MTVAARAAGCAEAGLIRLSAGTAARRAAGTSEARGLINRIDWTQLTGMLATRRLLSLLGERIVQLARGRAPLSLAQATGLAIQAGAERDGLLELVSIQLLDALEAADIPSLLLKGPALGRALYGKTGRRPSADIDLLVRAEDLHRAVQVATGLGYRDPELGARSDCLPLLHHRLVHSQPGLPVLELHWRVHWYEQQFSHEMLLRSSPGGALGRRPDPADELTSLLLFYARDGFVDLKLACDIATWWDTFGSCLPPGAVAEQIARYPALERALLAAMEVAEHVVGVPRLPLFREQRKRERRVRLAMRLANPDACGSITQRHADALLIDLLLTPHGSRSESVRRQLQTPSGTPAGQRPPVRYAPLAFGDHALRLVRRHVLGLVRVARERDCPARYSVTSRP